MEFQPTPPRGERRDRDMGNSKGDDISTHAPARGATFSVKCFPLPHNDFNPRPREGSDGDC